MWCLLGLKLFSSVRAVRNLCKIIKEKKKVYFVAFTDVEKKNDRVGRDSM